MSYLELYERPIREDPKYVDRFEPREKILASIRKQNRCDVLIVGGGIHGATFARIAAFHGLNTVLLEKHDYAFGTSSRSSKMAHGGLRYLEMLDFIQVLEGIRSREDLFKIAPHLVYPHPFFVPATGYAKLKLGIGLCIYDLFVRDRRRKHSYISNISAKFGELPSKALEGKSGYIYTDGIMNDARLVMENILAARQEGARCLNYAEATSFGNSVGGSVIVGYRDALNGDKGELQAGVIVNCAGPWVPSVGRITPGPMADMVRYSRGIHLIFNKPWNGPALFLPMPGKARYYFVWPHFAGTMVGTTEREINQLPEDPSPLPDEIEEVLTRLKIDLPGSELDREHLHYGFAGVRTLPLRSGAKNVAEISRRHIWNYSNGVLSLIGGKLTTANWTARQGLRKVFSLANRPEKVVSLAGKPLPGGAVYEDSLREFNDICKTLKIPDRVASETIRRLGSRVRFLDKELRHFEIVGNVVLRGEIEINVKVEQAVSLEDLMRRRLDLEYQPGNGLEVVDEIAKVLGEFLPKIDITDEVASYKKRIVEIQGNLLRNQN